MKNGPSGGMFWSVNLGRLAWTTVLVITLLIGSISIVATRDIRNSVEASADRIITGLACLASIVGLLLLRMEATLERLAKHLDERRRL